MNSTQTTTELPVQQQQEQSDVETGSETKTTTTATILPPEPVTGRGFLKPIPEITCKERVAAVVATVAVATALSAMIWERTAVVYVAGFLSCFVGAYGAHQQTMITDISALLETKDALKASVDKFQSENERLAENISGTTRTVENLKETDKALKALTATQGLTVEEFAQQVEQNKLLLANMRTNLRAEVLQNLMDLLLRYDQDKNVVLEESEIDLLIKRIKAMAGVRLNEERFRRAISKSDTTSVQDVMYVFKNLLRNNIPPEERIFRVDHGRSLKKQWHPSSK